MLHVCAFSTGSAERLILARNVIRTFPLRRRSLRYPRFARLDEDDAFTVSSSAPPFGWRVTVLFLLISGLVQVLLLKTWSTMTKIKSHCKNNKNVHCGK